MPLLCASDPEPHVPCAWSTADHPSANLRAFGFRDAPGGVHLSKTMLLADLTAVLAYRASREDVAGAILIQNILGKSTGTARRNALARLKALYGIVAPKPLQAVALHLWALDVAGRPMLALLCALAREPLLRETASVVLGARPGTPIRWPDLAATVEAAYPGRYSPKMLRSLAQNCASSWTQSSHLAGKVAKRRSPAIATPETAAYAALLGTVAGFGGPALLRSPWMAVLDRTEAEMLALLRRAESIGLARVRAGGGVVQIDVRQSIANSLEIAILVDH